MDKTAFIFPGQGSQSIGMGMSLAEARPEARQTFDQASQILGWDLMDACKNGPEDRLRQTDVAQPALYVTGVAAARVLRAQGVDPSAAAGHSIGEYAALASANVFSFEEGLSLVRERGKLMAEAATKRPGGMLAILGMDRVTLAKLCAAVAAEHGVCVPVNYNSPEQIVVAGEKKAIEALAPQASAAGAKRVIPLNVAGAFHSPLMAEAAAQMKSILSRLSFRDAAYPVAMNVDGQLRQQGSDIQSALAQQLDHSVEWVKSVEALKGAGCATFVECGSGRVLSGLVKKIDRALQVFSTESMEAVGQIQAIKA